MQLVSSNGAVLLEREKPQASKISTSTLRAKRMSHGMKKTVTPKLMSKEEFFTNVINSNSNAHV